MKVGRMIGNETVTDLNLTTEDSVKCDRFPGHWYSKVRPNNMASLMNKPLVRLYQWMTVSVALSVDDR